jgi:hypothetical protein
MAYALAMILVYPFGKQTNHDTSEGQLYYCIQTETIADMCAFSRLQQIQRLPIDRTPDVGINNSMRVYWPWGDRYHCILRRAALA